MELSKKFKEWIELENSKGVKTLDDQRVLESLNNKKFWKKF